MSKQKIPRTGIVYSTNPSFSYEEAEEAIESLVAARQPLKVRLDTKNRKGKAVTLVEGFTGRDADKEELAKDLKAYCGTGGGYKGGQILLQGDHRDKIASWLLQKGYLLTRKV